MREKSVGTEQHYKDGEGLLVQCAKIQLRRLAEMTPSIPEIYHAEIVMQVERVVVTNT